MHDIDVLLDRYIAMWNETDARRRRALLSATITEDASYLDPVMAGEGIEQIDAMIAAAQQQFPAHRFELRAGSDAHHDRVRFSWSLSAEDGERPAAVGVDFAVIADDGRMCSVTGFLEQVH